MKEWKEVKQGDKLPMMQGMAVNCLFKIYSPGKIEIKEDLYRITKNGEVIVYKDEGTHLKRVNN